ncbi:MAG: hypothetical protein OHK0013_06870 [Sandaracinaceae bacterium]
MRQATVPLVAVGLVLAGVIALRSGCTAAVVDGASEGTGAATTSTSTPRAERISRAEQQLGLARCGDLLEAAGPTSTPTFATLMRECAGLYAVRACRDVLREDEFSRSRVHEVCSAAYCGELRDPPSFCTRELPSDAEFLEQFADFSELVLRRDLRRVLDRDGATEIAELMGQLIRDQASQ